MLHLKQHVTKLHDRLRRGHEFRNLLPAIMLPEVTIGAIVEFAHLPGIVAAEDGLFFYKQAMSTRIAHELSVVHGQTVGQIFIDPNDIVKDTDQIAVMSHPVPGNAGGDESLAIEFRITVLFLDICVKNIGMLTVDGLVRAFRIAFQ